MKSIAHYKNTIAHYINIFGYIGIFYLCSAVLFKAKWIVPVARKWGKTTRIFLRLNSSDIPVFKQVFIDEEYGVLSALPSQKGVILDIGANIGLTSIYLSKKHPDKKIFSIEPDLSNYGIMCLNVSRISNIIPINIAIYGDSVNTLYIPQSGFSEWAKQTHTEKSYNAQEVLSCRIDDFLAKHAIDTIFILKIDVEGAESNIFLKNPQKWLNKVKAIIIELHESIAPGCTKIFRDAISQDFIEIASTQELTLVSRQSPSNIAERSSA